MVRVSPFLTAIGVAFVATLATSMPRQDRAIERLVIVSNSELSPPIRDKVFRQTSLEKARDQLGRSRYIEVEVEEYRFLFDSRSIGLSSLNGQLTLFAAMEEAAKKGNKVLDVSTLPDEQRDAIRGVLEDVQSQIHPSLRYLISSQNLKIALEPVSTAKFEANGIRKEFSAFPIQKQSDLQTPGEPTLSPSGGQSASSANPESLGPSMVLSFSPDLYRPSRRLEAMDRFPRARQIVTSAEFAKHDSAFRNLRNTLFELYKDQMGTEVPPANGEFSSLAKPLRDSFMRTIGAMSTFLGFSSRDEATKWLSGAQVVACNTYFNISFGGVRSDGGGKLFASIVLPRP